MTSARTSIRHKAAPADSPTVESRQRVAYLFLLDGQGSILMPGGIQQVASEIDRLGTPPEDLSLEVVISSGGGDPHSAFKLGKIIRARAGRVRYHIMEYAKSAATLLALSGDEIVMGPDAELGPLDVQMEHLNLEGKGLLSALENVKPLDDLLNTGEEATYSFGRQLRQTVQLSRSDAVDLASQHVCRLLSPVMEKLEPSAISQSMRALQITRVYAQDFLERYHYGEEFSGARRQAENVAISLIQDFPDHGFVIWRDMAREMGLHIVDGETDPHWNRLYGIYHEAGGRKAQQVKIEPQEDSPTTPAGEPNAD